METQENDLSNEAAALADILKWSAELPAWQQDALRRLCGQTKLEAADITALVGVFSQMARKPRRGNTSSP